MRFAKFGEFERGTLYNLLLNAYSAHERLVGKDKASWKKFDSFIYDNLELMEDCGFVTLEDEKPVGFISWDPRKVPDSVEIGHNCIIDSYKGQGLGARQLERAVQLILDLKPARITVKTGNDPFFEPAQRMYRTAGLEEAGRIHLLGDIVPEVIEFELIP